MPTLLPSLRDAPAAFTLAWYAVVLLVVFTTAFWIGRTVGPGVAEPEPAPHPAGVHP